MNKAKLQINFIIQTFQNLSGEACISVYSKMHTKFFSHLLDQEISLVKTIFFLTLDLKKKKKKKKGGKKIGVSVPNGK